MLRHVIWCSFSGQFKLRQSMVQKFLCIAGGPIKHVNFSNCKAATRPHSFGQIKQGEREPVVLRQGFEVTVTTATSKLTCKQVEKLGFGRVNADNDVICVKIDGELHAGEVVFMEFINLILPCCQTSITHETNYSHTEWFDALNAEQKYLGIYLLFISSIILE